MPQTLILDGHAISDIPSFYAEINRVFMANEDWQLGQSLDALDDMLYGGFGALEGAGPATLIWRGFEQSRKALGKAATRAWYVEKRTRPGRYDDARIAADLAALEAGTGPTYFDIVLEIFASHPRITLVRN